MVMVIVRLLVGEIIGCGAGKLSRHWAETECVPIANATPFSGYSLSARNGTKMPPFHLAE
jgi:hypothetical protein